LMHQGMAMLVLTVAVVHAQRITSARSVPSAGPVMGAADKLDPAMSG
jgi:hypothetical protein